MEPANTLSTFILLDRSGSMKAKWQETLSSLNAYVTELQKKGVNGDITVALFDEHIGCQFDVIRQSQPITEYQAIYEHEVQPRGGTPLFDSLARIIRLAKSRNNEKTIIVVMTDGEENASKEVTREHARDMLDMCKLLSWEAIFLGADFSAVKQQAQSLGISSNKFMNTVAGTRGMAMAELSGMAMNYCSTTGASIDIDAAVKAKYEGTVK